MKRHFKLWNSTFKNRLENNVVYWTAWTTQLWVNQNSFECYLLVTTRTSAAFAQLLKAN